MPALAVVGPTATGKSDLALDLAESLGGEIVNADAMQLYRGMDIGTAKVPVDRRRGIPHHQLDVLEVRQEASVAAYQREARADIARIESRGRIPIVVGGSGLYVRALLDDIAFPGTDPQVREDLVRRAEREGVAALYAELVERDPAAAARIDPANERRVVRALEVIAITGQPFSAHLPDHRYAIPAVQIGLDVDRAVLHERIERRAQEMFDDGLVAEVHSLIERGLREGRTANRAVGYAQALAVLDGVSSLPDAVASTTQATRQLARRQRTWFRRDPRITWLSAGEPLLERALALWRGTEGSASV